MGSYLSEPVTEKVSTDESDDRVSCGASCMQGWRVTQEDAHNCLIDFDKNTSLFAVYDGHGGHEVAHYCSLHLPNYIKNTEAYKAGDIDKALKDAFLGFDSTLATSNVINVLKEIAGDKTTENEEEGDEDEENVNHLYEEAAMPIEQVMEKYQSNLIQPNLKKLAGENGKAPVSPYLNAKNKSVSSSESGSPSKSDEQAGSSGVLTSKIDSTSSTVDSAEAEAVTSSSGGSGAGEPVKEPKKEENKDEKKCPSPTTTTKPDSTDMNGDCKVDSSSSPQTSENGVVSKGKGKALVKTKGAVQKQKKVLPKRNAQQLYNQLLDLEEESESDDEEDTTFVGVDSNSSDEDEAEISTVIEEEESEETSEEDEEDEEDECDDEDDEFARNMREEPGSDSGCTAVVALLQGKELYVANAGDSRCIVCRNGQAVEMSIDHKPEDEPERDRIVKAGGKVTCDGRVNGGLNLSRAIGDHAYKQNKDLSDREQMITALPDVKHLTLNPKEDEFMVLACDGIWNFMSSQEVVDFVRPKIQKGCEKLSQICEDMFDHCLAPDTMGDGTGCDNMTALIVQFKPSIVKRAADNEDETTSDAVTKRAKCLDN